MQKVEKNIWFLFSPILKTQISEDEKKRSTKELVKITKR